MDETEMCPNCKTTKYNKPSMKLMINFCGHVLCENCVEQMFFRGSGPCYKCGKLLKKNEFRDKVFDDAYIEKEVAIRKKHMKDLIRSENEFPSLREFNDYLEIVETLMFNLANNLEEEESIKKIEDLKREAKENAKSRTRFMMDSTTRRENPLYVYNPPGFYLHGPSLPTDANLIQSYVRNIHSDAVRVACGFSPQVPVNRLLSDAFADMYLSVRDA